MILDRKTSRKIFELARDQQEELVVPDDQDEDADAHDADAAKMQHRSRMYDAMLEESEDEQDTDGMSDVGDAQEMFVRHVYALRVRFYSLRSNWILGTSKRWIPFSLPMPENDGHWQMLYSQNLTRKSNQTAS